MEGNIVKYVTRHRFKNGAEDIQKIKDFVDGIRKVLPDDSQLQNIIDEVCELIDSTIYRLRELK